MPARRKRSIPALVLHSLRGRLMLLMLVAAIPAFVILLYATLWLREQAIAHNEERLLEQARTLASRHHEHVEATRRLLAGVADIAGASAHYPQSCRTLLQDAHRQAPAYLSSLFAVRPDGEILCATAGGEQLPNIADRRYFQTALAANGFSGGDYILSRFSGDPSLAFTHTVRRDGAVTLIVAATLDLGWLRRYRLAGLPAGAGYALFDKRGALLLRPESEMPARDEAENTAIWQTVEQLPEAGTFRGVGANNIARLYGYAPLGPAASPYGRLVVSTPLDSAHADADRLLRFGLFGLALACALGLLAGWAGGWFLVLRPMRPIFGTVRRVAAGDLNARTGVRAARGNEIALLATEIDRMAASLAAENRERRQVEEALRLERDRAQAYLDIVGVMVVALDENGEITLANRKACEVLACQEQSACVSGNWFEQFVPEEFRQEALGVFRRLLMGQADTDRHHESQILNRHGERRLIAWHNSLLRDGNGRIVGTLSAGDDVTESRRSEEQLRTTKEMLRLVTDTIPHHVFWKDRQSVYLGCNEAFARSANVASTTAIVGKTDFDLAWREQAEDFRRDDAQVMATGIARLNREEPRVLADGSRIWLETSKIPLRDAWGNVLGVLGLYRDITARKRLEGERERLQAQLQQAQKMEALGQLTGGIAHDFNNMLGSILGFSKLALQRHVPDRESKLAEYLLEVVAAGERARDLVAKMLSFSRTRPAAEPAAIFPEPLIRDGVRMLDSTLAASIRITSQFEADLPAIAIDPVGLQQILMNLAINARDAMNGRGRLFIGLRRVRHTGTVFSISHRPVAGDFVELAVADNGCGIPEENLASIFEPFFTTKPVGKGTGMGLSMVHGLMTQAGGHIVLETRPGEGSTFRLLFPVAADPAAAPAKAPVASAPRGGGQVLLVDDEGALLRMLSAVLGGAGYRVAAHANPLAALAAFRAAPDDFVAAITDETMPDLSGIELLAALHEIRPDLPVIVCSGYSDSLDESAALAAGARRYFHKPVDPEEVLLALAHEVPCCHA